MRSKEKQAEWNRIHDVGNPVMQKKKARQKKKTKMQKESRRRNRK